MKRLYFYAITLAVAGLVLQACTVGVEQFDDVAVGSNVAVDMAGTWDLTSVVQVDTRAEFNGWPMIAQRFDITDLFPYDEASLTLELDEEGKPSTFNFVQGNAPQLFPAASGTWNFDVLTNPDENTQELIDAGFIVPEVLTFTGGGVSNSYSLGSVANLAGGEMGFSLVISKDEEGTITDIIRYDYTFTRREVVEN